MLHPWLLYLSAHLKPILFFEASIMSSEYTWIWICHHMCIFTGKIARIYTHVFIYTENILIKFYYHHYHHCIYCTIVHFMFACLQLFCYFHICFCPLFSFITSAMAMVMFSSLSVACLSVCLSVSNITEARLNGFSWHFQGRWDLIQGTIGDIFRIFHLTPWTQDFPHFFRAIHVS